MVNVLPSGRAKPEEMVGRVTESLAALVEGSETRPVAARVIVQGATEIHARLLGERARWSAELRAAAQRVSTDRLWLEKVQFATRLPASFRELVCRIH